MQITVIFHGFKLGTVLGHGMCIFRFFPIVANGSLCYDIACAHYGNFLWLRIGTCVRGGHARVTAIFHAFPLETCVRRLDAYVTFIFHGFELGPVLGDCKWVLRSFSMVLNWDLCWEMACACYGHFPLF